MRHAGQPKAHLDSAERSRQHQIVEAAEMSDAKDFAGELCEASSEGHVKVLEDDAPQPIRVMALRHEDCGERVRVLAGIFTNNFQAPGSHRGASRLRVPPMPAKYIGQALLVQHRQRVVVAERRHIR